jgi:hypothetical protein
VADYNTTTAQAIASSGGYVNTLLGHDNAARTYCTSVVGSSVPNLSTTAALRTFPCRSTMRITDKVAAADLK